MPELNDNEMEVMRVLWQGGAFKPADIQSQFAWPIENATLRSVLRNLVAKGHATRKKEGKAFYYRARSSRASLLTRMTRRMADVFAGGSAAGLIAHLIEKEHLTEAEIEELRRVASQRGGRKKS